jgi:hypothetical protein
LIQTWRISIDRTSTCSRRPPPISS